VTGTINEDDGKALDERGVAHSQFLTQFHEKVSCMEYSDKKWSGDAVLVYIQGVEQGSG